MPALTWKTYQEDMPKPCALGEHSGYAQKHDPFVYFDPIRNDTALCSANVAPLEQLSLDLAAKQLPNFALIVPNQCHSAHDCPIDTADTWLAGMMDTLLASGALGDRYLIFITFDEARGDNSSCCGLPSESRWTGAGDRGFAAGKAGLRG